MEFFSEGEENEPEIDANYAQLMEGVEELEFKNMLSNEGDEIECGITNYCWSWRN